MSDTLPPVLLVEDDDISRMMLGEVLSLSGYRVQEAENYQSALRQMKDSPAAIAIIDLRLPDGNGLDLIQELKETYTDLVPLISTGHGSLQTAVEAVRHGAYAYLLKPYEPQALLAVLRQASEKWNLEHQNRLLLKQTRAEADRVTALLQASEEINTAFMDIESMTRRVVQTAVRIMAARAGYIALFEENALAVREWWDGATWYPLERTFEEGEGGPGYVWQSRSTYRSDTASHDPRLVPSLRRVLSQQTMICCPILTRYGEFLGVLDLSDKNGGEPFNDDDVRFLEGLCRHIAVALENARLYEEQRKSEEQRKQFYKDVVCAATHNKLILSERMEIDSPPRDADLRMRVDSAEDIGRVRTALAHLISRTEMKEERVDGLILCVGEAATNAFKHGNGGEASVWMEDQYVLVRIEDHGPGIDATTLPKATLMPGFSTKTSLGMGLTIILEFVDQVRLSTGASGTILEMKVCIDPPEMDPFDLINIQEL